MHCADRISCNGVGGDGGYYGVWGGPVLGTGVEEWDGGGFWGGGGGLGGAWGGEGGMGGGGGGGVGGGGVGGGESGGFGGV